MELLRVVNTGTKYVARKDGIVRVRYSDKVVQQFEMNKGENLTLYGDNYAIFTIKES